MALALAPGRGYGFSLEAHESISQTALTDKGYDADAAKAVILANRETDKHEWTSPPAHFDSERFADGSQRLAEAILAAVDALDDCKPDKARTEVGRVLHGVQDFFAHSNWVENHGASDPIDMFTLQDPPKDLVCDQPSHKGGLTSGYFSYAKPPAPPPAGKCGHDYINDEKPGLNKDKPGRKLHDKAVERALAESKTLLGVVEREIYVKYHKTGMPQARYRIRLLKDTSEDFAVQRRQCVPRPMSPPKR